MELIQTVGFTAVRLLWEVAQASMNVKIHNKCKDFELVDPLHFSDGAVYCNPLAQKVAPGGTLDTTFKVNPTRMAFEGALLCRLRKKETNSDQQSEANTKNADATNSDQQPEADTKNIDENEPDHIRLLVGWKVERFKEPCVYMLLGEHGGKYAWNKDKLKKQHNEFRGQLNAHRSAVENTWLIEDGSTLKLVLDSVGNKEYEINITLSEGQKDSYATIPVSIESKV
jgi:hypothetical protein